MTTEARIRAPELPDHLEWLNTTGPIRLAEQRGKVVLLDFWTYCCINCQHVLADLRYLENKYADGLTVIGIHSPKFPNEKVTAQVRKAINRHHIQHPVANDPELTVWREYAIQAWPSLILIDPEGYVVGVLRGEGRRRQLDDLVSGLLEKAEQQGIRRRSPTKVTNPPEPAGSLRFPGKVLASERRIYVSNTGHNRVLELDHTGLIRRRFGSGSPALLDGREEESAFNAPQGLALVGDTLYVADEGNHAIRAIDLVSGDVATVAGCGEQGIYEADRYDRPGEARLNSPWDIAFHDGDLFIAMAGQHQVWRLDLADSKLEVYAGSGREGIADGQLRTALFAQPSGVEAAEGQVFVADAETSAVRLIRPHLHNVNTLVGRGLFIFGDADGPAPSARLQHPLGIALDLAREVLWIADTYNHKIKKLDLNANVISQVECSQPLYEPGGLSLSGGLLFVANTNAHEILRLDPETGKAEVIPVHD